MKANSINPELHNSLLQFHDHCNTVLASSRDIEAVGNLTVGTIRLVAGKVTAQANAPAARLQADRENLGLVTYVQATVQDAYETIFGEGTPLWGDFTFRHLKPLPGEEGYAQSIDLRAGSPSPVSFMQSERIVDQTREGLSIVVNEGRLVVASLTRVSEQSEAFARRCSNLFAERMPDVLDGVMELLTGEFDGQEDLEDALHLMRSLVMQAGYSPETRDKALDLLSEVPTYAAMSVQVSPIDRDTVDGFTDFVNSLAAK